MLPLLQCWAWLTKDFDDNQRIGRKIATPDSRFAQEALNHNVGIHAHSLKLFRRVLSHRKLRLNPTNVDAVLTRTITF